MSISGIIGEMMAIEDLLEKARELTGSVLMHRRLLIKALRQVEFVQDDSEMYWCPWCDYIDWEGGHEKDCIRQRALNWVDETDDGRRS